MPFTVVHLGNLDHEPALAGEKTAKYAARFPRVKFIGIDLKKREGPLPQNWVQIQADFAIGLSRLNDESVDLITSEAALGHYGRDPLNPRSNIHGHTVDALKMAFKKLKPRGKLMITVLDQILLGSHREYLLNVLNALKETKFKPTNVSWRELSRHELSRTAWLRQVRIVNARAYCITANK